MQSVTISSSKSYDLRSFLESNEFLVEDLTDGVFKVTRESELPVYVHVADTSVYFELDLGNVSSIASEDLYFKILDMNTEILPVSFAINNTNSDDPRLVLVESRETSNLDDNEVLSVFAALELATDRAEVFLSGMLKTASK